MFSLNLATNGLLKSGAKKTLAIITFGFLRSRNLNGIGFFYTVIIQEEMHPVALSQNNYLIALAQLNYPAGLVEEFYTVEIEQIEQKVELKTINYTVDIK